MARKPTGNPVGPPPKPVDWTMFEQLCGLQCTQSEMGSFLHICEDTLNKKVKEHYGEEYSVIYKKFSETGKCSLRRNQFVQSKKSAAMAIWLGKHWLGQKDREAEQEKTNTMNSHLEMLHQMLKENKFLKDEINAIKSQTNTELPRSNSQI